jgi:hypothetical protein
MEAIMKRTWILSFSFLLFALSANAANPVYTMNGFQTDIWNQDVDYFSQPITLVRNASTQFLHRVNFDVSRYEVYCAYYTSTCVQTDSQGRCTRYEQVCGRWEQREYPVQKTIELNFRKAAVLTGTQEETYELSVHRWKPSGDGEDDVMTSLREITTLQPVTVRKLNTYDYDVIAK